MNNPVLPLLALIVSILTWFLPLGGPPSTEAKTLDDRKRASAWLGGLCAFALAGFFVATKVWPSTFPFGSNLAISAGYGMLAVVFAWGAERNRVWPLAMALLGVCAAGLFPEAQRTDCFLAFVFGMLFCATIGSFIDKRVQNGYRALIYGLAIVLGNAIGLKADPLNGGSAGIAIAVSVLISAVVVGATHKLAKKTISEFVTKALLFVLILACGFLVCWRYLNSMDLAAIFAGAMVIAGVVSMLLTDEAAPDSFRFILSTVLWIAAGTIAFGMNQGYGMAIALLGGCSGLLVFGGVRSLNTLGVLGVLVSYRLFRELDTDATKALDIGQHYALIGIAIGTLSPLLPSEWIKARSLQQPTKLAGVASILWLALIAALPVGAAIFLGPKGAIGMLAGLGLAPVVIGLAGSLELRTMAIALGLSVLSILEFGWIQPLLDLTRDEKLAALKWMIGVAVLLGAALTLVTSRMPAGETSDVAA